MNLYPSARVNATLAESTERCCELYAAASGIKGERKDGRRDGEWATEKKKKINERGI